MEQFVHLHVHSEYSLLDGACRIEELVSRVKALGMTAVALTDKTALYGAVPFYKTCIKYGIKPIFGVELTITTEAVGVTKKKFEQPSLQIVLLAENLVGYKNIVQLVTRAHLDSSTINGPVVSKQTLEKYSSGIIAIVPAMGGEIQGYIAQKDMEQAVKAYDEYRNIYGEQNLYLEIAYHGLEDEMMVNQRMVRFAAQHGANLVAANNVYYLKQSDATVHDILRCIGSGTHLTDPNRNRLPNDQFFLKSPEEMLKLFTYHPAAVTNTMEIAARCNCELTLGDYILPKYPVVSGQTAGSYLRELCIKGLHQRFRNPSDEAKERLEYELSVINKMGFADYFLIVWDFMQFAHDQNILTGPGRGSAAGSLVAYTLFITDIDPLHYKLLFERFLNPERISMPDIDIDFEVERRSEVIRYVTDKYGPDHVAQIITFGTMAARAAIRDVGRVLNYPPKIVDVTAKLVHSGSSIDESLKESSELKQAYEENEQVQKLLQLARAIEGFPRHVSTHAAGIVISREPLTEYVPLQRGNEGFSLTQFAMENLEEIGLLKMDFLGLRNLTILDYTIRLVRKNSGTGLDLKRIPHNDTVTFEILAKGDTTGIFQLESPGMRKVLREVIPTRFEDLIAILALYRPGPMEIIPQYAAAKNGRKSVTYIHPDIESILSDTYGFILYQEQIMQIAAKMAGYSLGQADVLRRAVSKKKREILEEERTSFVEGCQEQGYSFELGQELYDLIVRFADYGFNRSHSAAYSLIAYQMAYLKANYPVEFMTSLLSMSIGSPEKVAEYVEEARKKGIHILPPNINHSIENFSIREGEVLFGLSAIKHVGTLAVRSILEERRKNGLFKDLFDFCKRVDLRVCNRRVVEVLIQCGSMDGLPGHRVQKLSILDQALEKGSEWKKEHESGQFSLFEQVKNETEESEILFPEIPPFTVKENLQLEKELLGLYISGHPLDEFDHIFGRKEVVRLNELPAMKTGETILAAGVLVDVKTIVTKKGEAMAFAVVEDKLAQAEIVAFPSIYNRYLAFIKKEKKIVLEGKVEVGIDGKQKIIVQKIWDMTAIPKPQEQKKQAEQVLFIKISEQNEQTEVLEKIQHILLEHPGNSSVCLYYAAKKQAKMLQDKYRVKIQDELIAAIAEIVGEASISVKK